MPDDGVMADGVASPIVTDSVKLNADPALVIALSVCIKAGTPSVNDPTFNQPIAPDVVDPPEVTEGVILFPLRLYVVPNLFVTLYGISTVICAEVVNFWVISAKDAVGSKSKSGKSFFMILVL